MSTAVFPSRNNQGRRPIPHRVVWSSEQSHWTFDNSQRTFDSRKTNSFTASWFQVTSYPPPLGFSGAPPPCGFALGAGASFGAGGGVGFACGAAAGGAIGAGGGDGLACGAGAAGVGACGAGGGV